MSQPSFSTYGAVDLSTLARPAAPPRGRSTPGQPNGSGSGPRVVLDVTEETFEAEVIRRSMTVPVVLDMWADWCGPCKQLSPILERLAEADGGRWVLAKIDIEANQRLAAAFQVQSIPAVFAVIKGQPLPLFQGALPEGHVRRYLDELLRVAAASGVSGSAGADSDGDVGPDAGDEADGQAGGASAEPPGDPRFEEAYDAIERGDYEAAAAAYRSLLASSPADEDAKAGLAQVELLRRVSTADPQRALRAADASPDDADAQLLAADVDLLENRVEQAFSRLIALVSRSNGDVRNAARARLLELFEIVGPADPRVARARTALANALF